MVKLVFDKCKNGLCSRSGLHLFDDEAVATSNRILEEIRQDQNGLMRYRCSRGTSSVEGSVHFNIIRKFASYNAGPRLTDAVLSDYRLYHNISMGSITRHGKVHTKEETELFDKLLVSQRDLITSENSSNIMFNIFARLWSSYCQAGNSIYYKTEKHLYAYYNILEDRKKYGNTVLMNIDISQFVRLATQNPARCYDCLRVSAIVQPLQPSSVVITQMFDRQRNLAYTPVTRIQPRLVPNAINQSIIVARPVPIVTRPPAIVARILLPDPSTLSPVLDATPPQKRRREMCKVCNQSDCGGRSKRILCTNKCGKCQRNGCTGRYVVGRNTPNIPCEFTSQDKTLPFLTLFITTTTLLFLINETSTHLYYHYIL
ncbi:hypothetical protein INT47_007387 [Mucor saturninus]|uniref:Uncharacterized protein n=1 Tax=Mucor saturninus TaxID=64648 RepID=A0A8H7UWV2_9FUNG|nr:hypothetical protein INT47_007387 [Mucor saturninus]